LCSVTYTNGNGDSYSDGHCHSERNSHGLAHDYTNADALRR
jgi:hypothetical protein